MKYIFFNKVYIKVSLYCIALVTCLMCACNKKASQVDENELTGVIRLSGAFALYPLVNIWAEEFREEHPRVRFSISAGGAGKGMTDVLSGAIDLGMFSREITEVEQSKGVWWIAVTKDAVVPTISDKNPVLKQLKKEGLTKDELIGYYIKGGKYFWKGTSHEVRVFTRSDASGAAGTWAQYLGGNGQESLKGIAVYGDPGLADAVKRDSRAIGFNNIIFIYDLNTGVKYEGIEVVPLDLNNNGVIDEGEDFYESLEGLSAAISDGRYPSPPARELYLLSNGTPKSPVVKAFLQWIIEKGQGHISKNGYIPLNPEVLEEQKLKLLGDGTDD